MKAAVHPRQADRLAALRRYDILDTPREAEFDDIVALASTICDAPISVVNLIDEHRQWFKAEVGLGVRETPLETSICSHVILENDFVEIPDTLADARMADNPLCLAPEDGLRFYAGALLKTSDGMPIGTLCVLDTKPRNLTDLQRETVRVLARQVMKQLELRLALRQLDTLRRETDHRVKNSLQMIASLVSIGRSGGEGAADAALERIESRIRAASLIHEQIQKSSTSGDVDIARLLTDLGRLLQDMSPDGIAIEVKADSVDISPDQATAIATLINEFAANSFKHAFTGVSQGCITLTASSKDGAIKLECSDDGRGWGEDGPKGGLGYQIMQASAEKAGGKIELIPLQTGSALRLVFKPEQAA